MSETILLVSRIEYLWIGMSKIDVHACSNPNSNSTCAF